MRMNPVSTAPKQTKAQRQAEQRSSRVGRHHADRYDDYLNQR